MKDWDFGKNFQLAKCIIWQHKQLGLIQTADIYESNIPSINNQVTDILI